MKKKILILVGLSILFLLPSLGLADCCDFGGYDESFAIEDYNTVILQSKDGRRLGRFRVQCSVHSTSKIGLLRSFVCDGDEVLIDGARCMVDRVKESGK